MTPEGSSLEARTRVIGIDGGMDPTPNRTDNDIANTNLIRSLIAAIRRYRPATEDQMVDTYDALDALLDNFTCECGDTIFFVFSGHGNRDGVAFPKERDRDKRIYSYIEIALKLMNADKECCCKIYFLLEACNSGAGIDELFSDEHVIGVYTSTTRDTVSRYNRKGTEVTAGWLWQLIRMLDDVHRKRVESDESADLDDALGEAHGRARDSVGPQNWHDGEHPQAFRRDTFAIYGHVREMITDRWGYYIVVEVYDPYWRRGYLDTIRLDDWDDFDKFRKCNWIQTNLVYESPFGNRDHIGPITEADHVKDQLISAHVMKIKGDKVQVHVTWPRHMYCREIWIENPKEVYKAPDIQMPELPARRTNKNKKEYDRIKAERKRIEHLLKEHEKEWRKNAKHRKISVCRWVEQEVDIIDPTATAKAKEALKPFGRKVTGLMHVRSVDRKKGTISIRNRNSWLNRYKYNRIKVPDSIMRHLDTLNKDRLGRPRALKRCDNIRAQIWIPGRRDSVPTLLGASVVKKGNYRSTAQTRLSLPSVSLAGNTGIVVPEVSIINNDEINYDALVHFAIYEHGRLGSGTKDQILSFKNLLDGSLPKDRTIDIPDTNVNPSSLNEDCSDLLNKLYTNHRSHFNNIEAEIQNLMRANYLMHFWNQHTENSMSRYPNVDNFTQGLSANQEAYQSFWKPQLISVEPNNSKPLQLALGFPQTTRFSNQLDLYSAYLHSTISCAENELINDFEKLWSDAIDESEEVLKHIENGRVEFETGVENLLVQRFSSLRSLGFEFHVDCIKNLVSHIGQTAISNPDMYLNATPTISRIGLHKSILSGNDFQDFSYLDQNSGIVLPIFEEMVEVFALEPGDTKLINFSTQVLSPGKLYTVYYWRADKPSESVSETSEEWSYQAQDTLAVQFFIRNQEKCDCNYESLSLTAIATGEMNGTVFQMNVKNQSDKSVLCQLGPYLSPGDRKKQSIYMPNRLEVSLLPGEEVILPLSGYCLDHYLPPPKKGSMENPNSDWVSLPNSNQLERFQNYLFTDSTGKPARIEGFGNNSLALTRPGFENLLYLEADPKDWYQILPADPSIENISSRLPNRSHFTRLAVINDQVLSIAERTLTEMYYLDEINTPLGYSGEEQQTFLTQLILWRYNSGLNKVPYSFADFEKKIKKEIQKQVPKKTFKNKESANEIQSGLLDIWKMTELVGLQAGLWK
jgi:hypothetical protein